MGSKALLEFVRTIKDADRAKTSPERYLEHVINTYCQSGQFDSFCTLHAQNIPQYVADHNRYREGMFRASAAGNCLQAQAFDAIRNRRAAPKPMKITLAARRYRAMHNGTFAHLRWHILFDALHEEGSIRTLFAEVVRYNRELDLDGSIDRVVQFDFNGASMTAILDFKTIKRHSYENLLEPPEAHAMQLHDYRLLWETIEEHPPDLWVMLYENKDNQDIKIFARPFDELMLRRLRNNYELLQQWVGLWALGAPIEELPKLPLSTAWCSQCPWQNACLEFNPDLPEIQAAQA